MKKVLAFILIVALALPFLFSCGSTKYKPVESTEEEKRVIMTLSFEGEKYEVRYELYRALFLNLKNEVDGGDASVWSGSEKDKYIEKIDALIIEKAAQIFATFHLCKKVEIDVYSRDYEKRIDKYITLSVDGGYDGNNYILGFGGDYAKYLASLKAMNLNYSVQVLMLRYALALEDIEVYYGGNLDEEQFVDNVQIGKLQYTKEDVRAFYNSDECVRIIHGILRNNLFSKERAKEIRDKMSEKAGEKQIVAYIINYMADAAASEIENGELIARYNLNSNYFKKLTDAAFALNLYETSEPIEIITGAIDAYHIIYRAEKTEEYYENCYDDIATAYVRNEIGKLLFEAESELVKGTSLNDELKMIDRSAISME